MLLTTNITCNNKCNWCYTFKCKGKVMKYEDIKKYVKELKKRDTIAIVSLSSGLAGEELFRHRYEQGKNIF